MVIGYKPGTSGVVSVRTEKNTRKGENLNKELTEFVD